MLHHLRGAAIGLLALLTLALAAGTASATGTGPVRINTSASTATLNNSTVSVLTTAGIRGLICRTMTLGDTISSSGTFAANSVSFNTCTFSGTNVTVTPSNLPWGGRIRHLDNGITGGPSAFTLDITGMLIDVTGAACRFTLSGNVLGTAAISASHGTLASIPPFAFPAMLAPNPLGLVVSNVSGFCLQLFSLQNGNLAAFFGVKGFSPVLVGAAL